MKYETKVPETFRRGKMPKCRTVGALIKQLEQLPKGLPVSGDFDPRGGVNIVVPVCNDDMLTCDIRQDDD